MKVIISGLNKTLLLEALYNGAFYQTQKFEAPSAIEKKAAEKKITPLTKRILATQFIKARSQGITHPNYQFGTVDLGEGPRELSIDLSDSEVDVTAYNTLHGDGAAQNIIAKLRSELPKDLEKTTGKSEEKYLFYDAIQDNADWLKPVLLEVEQALTQEEKAHEFNANLCKLISEQKDNQYERMPEQAIYLTWIKMLDPKLDAQTKEKICLELAQRYAEYQSGQTYKTSIGSILSYMPSIIAAPILLYAPNKILLSYYEYQKRYGKYSNELNDKYFEKTLKFLATNTLFPKEAKTRFLKKCMALLKQQPHPSYLYQDDTDYVVHEAMASWEKKLLTSFILDLSDGEMKTEHNKFREKLNKAIETPDTRLALRTELGSLVFEKLLVEYKYNAEKLTPLAAQINNDDEIDILATLYEAHGLDKSMMFKRHLIQLAKHTNESQYQHTSLFFSSALKYLGKDANAIAREIASFLSPEYYAEYIYAFTTINKEMLLFWIEHNPAQIIAIIKAFLAKPKDHYETPIDNFFNKLSYAEMPASFFDKLALLLTDSLTPEQFIRTYSAAKEETQLKFLTALVKEEEKALGRLKNLNEAYKSGEFSVVFARKISSQLKITNPELHKQAETEKLFIQEEAKDDLKTDLRLLQKILANKSLTQNQQRLEINQLKNLHAGLRARTGAWPVVLQMFNSIPQTHWPDLFVNFTSQINYWSVPYNKEEGLIMRSDTWLSHQSEWEKILYGTLVTVLSHLSRNDSRSNVAQAGLIGLHEAFIENSTHFPKMVEKILKKFFLENAPNSITIFKALHDTFGDKDYAPTYFSKQGIYSLVASWLPEDTLPRTTILAKLLQVEGGFDLALKTPFVRTKEEVTQTILSLLSTRTEHFVRLLEKLSSYTKSILFKSMSELDGESFLVLLQNAFSDITKAELPLSYYMTTVVMLLNYSNTAHIDIFKIIDADPNKEVLLKRLGDIEIWKKQGIYLCPYDLIFRILFHYQPEQAQKIVAEHIKYHIGEDKLYDLCSCIKAFQKITCTKLVLPQLEEEKLIDYLTKKMKETFNHYSGDMEVMAIFIPNFDKVFLELLGQKTKDLDSLSQSHKNGLDQLVKIYGFSHIKGICSEFNLKTCNTYLNDKFSQFPDILRQIDEAIKSYDTFFDGHKHRVNQDVLWRFYDNLRSAIFKDIEKSETSSLDINIAEIATKSGIEAGLIALIPSLKIIGSGADKKEVKEAPKPSSKTTVQETQPQLATEVQSLTDHFGLYKRQEEKTDQPKKSHDRFTCRIL